MRNLPSVELTDCPSDYARHVAQGYDSVQECYALSPTGEFQKILEESQAAARELRDDLEGTVQVILAGEVFRAHSTGAKGGFRWRLENDDFLIMVGSPRREWTISIRYLSGGLWEYGHEELRERALACLRPYTAKLNFSDWQRVSRVDYCFDFYSPTFTKEFIPGLARNVVCHSSAKTQEAGSYNIWARGGRGETLTIGSKSGLQVQLYDKTLEIDEASGKTWLYDVWAKSAGMDLIADGDKRPKNVWRLEARFSSEFLKDRNLRRPKEVYPAIPELLAEALYLRRLGNPSATDDNRWRWPMHPIWSEAVRLKAAGTIKPLGRMVTGRRAALVDRAEMSLAGAMRSASILEGGDFDDGRVFDLIERARGRIQADPGHARKVREAVMRYSLVDQAR